MLGDEPEFIAILRDHVSLIADQIRKIPHIRVADRADVRRLKREGHVPEPQDVLAVADLHIEAVRCARWDAVRNADFRLDAIPRIFRCTVTNPSGGGGFILSAFLTTFKQKPCTISFSLKSVFTYERSFFTHRSQTTMFFIFFLSKYDLSSAATLRRNWRRGNYWKSKIENTHLRL